MFKEAGCSKSCILESNCFSKRKSIVVISKSIRLKHSLSMAGHPILSTGRAASPVGKALLVSSACEEFNKEISMIFEYE